MVGTLTILLLAQEMTLPQEVELKLHLDDLIILVPSSAVSSSCSVDDNSLKRSFDSSFSFKGFLSISITLIEGKVKTCLYNSPIIFAFSSSLPNFFTPGLLNNSNSVLSCTGRITSYLSLSLP